MSRIHLPPSRADLTVIPTCVRFDGVDSLEIDIDHPGYFVHTPNGDFDPELPSGKLDKQILIVKPTVGSDTAYLAYYDSKTPGIYLVVITIQTGPCPPDSEGSEE